MPPKFTRTYNSIATKQELKEQYNCPIYESFSAVPAGYFTHEYLKAHGENIPTNTPPDGIVMNQKFGAFKRLYKKSNS